VAPVVGPRRSRFGDSIAHRESVGREKIPPVSRRDLHRSVAFLPATGPASSVQEIASIELVSPPSAGVLGDIVCARIHTSGHSGRLPFTPAHRGYGKDNSPHA
jgi:hypothetical protein